MRPGATVDASRGSADVTAIDATDASVATDALDVTIEGDATDARSGCDAPESGADAAQSSSSFLKSGMEIFRCATVNECEPPAPPEITPE